MFAPQVLYRISWHINDPKTWMSFAQVCKRTADAARHWMKVKKTQYRKPFSHGFVLPNGEFHGPATLKYQTYDLYYLNGYCSREHTSSKKIILVHQNDYHIKRGRFHVVVNSKSFSAQAYKNVSSENIYIQTCPYCSDYHYTIKSKGLPLYISPPCDLWNQ